jgi:putative FmdB family regulatory protein
MPTYEYLCDNCGHEFERFQAITAKVLRKCPKCGKKELKRLIGTGAGVIFKGTGFYQTDYRSESYKEAERSEKDAGDSEKKEPKKKGGETKPKDKTNKGKKDKKKSA